MIIETKPNTIKMTHDLKEMMLEMLEQVPGDNKKIDPRAKNFYQDTFAYVGVTEFEGTMIPFIACLDSNVDDKGVLSFEPSVFDIHYYDNRNQMETFLGDHTYPADDHAWYDGMTDETMAKMRKYNAYPFCDYDLYCDFSFRTQDFSYNDHPRIAWAIGQLASIKPKIKRYYATDFDKTYHLPDLTPVEVKRAETHVDFKPLKRTKEQEDKLVANATNVFLTDLKRIYHEVPDQLPSSLFDICERFALDFNKEDHLKSVRYANKRIAIKFTKHDLANKCYHVKIFYNDGRLAANDTIHVLSDLYELHYGLTKIAEEQNKALIAKLTKEYFDHTIYDSEQEYRDACKHIGAIDIDKL